jgi:hypothetical protein
MNVSGLDVVKNAKAQSRQADGTEAIELGSGNENVLVIRW